MKKRNVALPIAALALAILAYLMLVLSPLYLGTNKFQSDPSAVVGTLNMGLGKALMGIFLFSSGVAYGIVSLVMLVVLLVFWILHIVVASKAHRKGAILPDVAWILGGAISFVIILGCISNGYLFDGKVVDGAYAAYEYKDLFAYIGYVGGISFLALIPFLLAVASYVVGLVMIVRDVIACGKEKAAKTAAIQEEKERKEVAKENAEKQEELKKAQKDELNNVDENELITSDELRQIIREEMRADSNKAPSGLTQEQVRTIVAQELDKRFLQRQNAIPKEETIKEEPKKEEAKPQTIAVNITAPVSPFEKKEDVKPVVTVVSTPMPAVKKTIIRIPFPQRLDAADKNVKNNYNEIKAEALSFGLKSRLSNSGDTFRLHTKTYFKITVAGKGLKIYYALDPKAYADSPIPLKDVSGKNLYKEIPACFKVKSDLSVRRAKQLIADVCAHDKIVQGKINPRNYAAEMKSYKPQNSADNAEKN